jgi:hypothetical protein
MKSPATLEQPADFPGWHVLPRQQKEYPAFYIDEPHYLFSNPLSWRDWDPEVLATLVGKPAEDDPNGAHERKIFVVLRDLGLRDLDGFGLASCLNGIANATGAYVKLTTYRHAVLYGRTREFERVSRETVAYGFDPAALPKSGAHLTLFTKEFFDKHNPRLAGNDEHTAWVELHNQMGTFTAERDRNQYNHDIVTMLERNLFHDSTSGWSMLRVLRRDDVGAIESLTRPVWSVVSTRLA